MTVIQNAKINKAMLGREDHGIMTFWLMMQMDGTSQGYGGYFMDDALLGQSITGITDLFGPWENLAGKPARIFRASDGWNEPIRAIGHFMEDKWFFIAQSQPVEAKIGTLSEVEPEFK